VKNKCPNSATVNLTIGERLLHVKIYPWGHTLSKLGLEEQMGFTMAEKKRIAAKYASRCRKTGKKQVYQSCYDTTAAAMIEILDLFNNPVGY
jgi:hypothetical protein